MAISFQGPGTSLLTPGPFNGAEPRPMASWNNSLRDTLLAQEPFIPDFMISLMQARGVVCRPIDY